MLGRTFGKRNAPGGELSGAALDPASRAFLDEIERRKPTEPLIGVKAGAFEVVQQLLKAMKDERGVHAETLLGVLGSLAGFACPAGVVASAGGRDLKQIGVLVVETNNGSRYLYGNPINAPLLEGAHNVYGLVWGMARHLGAASLDYPDELLKHVVSTLGTPAFGAPRIPEGHDIAIEPFTAVRELWPATSRLRDTFCDTPSQWPILYGLAAQRAMQMAKDAVEPILAARIVVECAVPMSKLDPRRFLQ